ncbi:MAG: methylenetetrahydrofolate reductase [Burkholderiales bacterium]|nr:MAG: methylenetetrahydrofolate reductase [Burkholderiales bacterium]
MLDSPSAAPAAHPAVRELLADASIEVSARDLHDAASTVREVGAGRQVFIPWTPNVGPGQLVAATARARELGLVPVPHVVARRIASESAARELLAQLRRNGAESVLVIGGDLPEPAGPYRSGYALMRTGLLQASGLAEVGVAGYPEGHPRIAAPALRAELDLKLDYARQSGLRVFVVSQFCFDGALIARWVGDLRARGVAVPVRAGVAGPTTLTKLLKLGVQCGVGHSLRALRGRLGALARLAATHEPGDVIRDLAEARLAAPSLDPLSVHVFAFGGIGPTARWLGPAHAAIEA